MASFRSRKSELRVLSVSGIAVICLIFAAICLIFVARDDRVIGTLSQLMSDAFAPTYDVISRPSLELRKMRNAATNLVDLQASYTELEQENQKLREQLVELRRTRVLLDRYRELLALPVEPSLHVISARVIADLQSPFVRTLVANTGRMAGVQEGQAVTGGRGLIGRVVSVGRVSSRLLLLTDFNSHVPVLISPSNTRAILSGNNADRPVLRFLPKNARIEEGAQVVTSGKGGQVPIGIPIGVVRFDGNGSPYVDLLEDFHNLSYVRIISTRAIEPPPSDPDTQILTERGR
ncbi:MAG: Cell shape-determining protein MreC [Rhodobiaceae bacterium UBA7378]|nr:MAG: Cell shape-determining protein MreC [Rhodobiaceae bacterium UBA7378]